LSDLGLVASEIEIGDPFAAHAAVIRAMGAVKDSLLGSKEAPPSVPEAGRV
jgi:hypothetical protein